MNGKCKWDSSEKFNIFSFIDNNIKQTRNIQASCRNAISHFNLDINELTLRFRYDRYKNNNGKERSNMLFSIKMEQSIVSFLEQWALANRPLSKSLLFNHLNTLRSIPSGWNASGWFTRFLARNSKKLQNRVVQCLKDDKENPNMNDHLSLLLNFLDKLDINKKKQDLILVNCDETRLTISENKKITKVIDAKYRMKRHSKGATLKKSASYLPFHSPDKLLFNFFILPLNNDGSTNFHVRKANHSTRGSTPTYFSFSPSGWLNSDIFLEIIKIFNVEMNKLYPDKKIILFMDRLSIHLDNRIIKYGVDNRIEMIYFPVASTGFIQPSDQHILSVFKKLIKSEVIKRCTLQRGNKLELGEEIVSIAQDMTSRITVSIIQSSWAETGLFPYDRKKIEENFKIYFGQYNNDEDEEIIKKIKNLTKSIISDTLDKPKSSSIKISPAKNSIFTGRELLIYQEENKKNKSKKHASSSVNDYTNSDDISIGVANAEIISKKKPPKKLKCLCPDHDIDEDQNTEYITCEHCLNYSFCSDCYCQAIEQYILHEEGCRKTAGKSKRRKIR